MVRWSISIPLISSRGLICRFFCPITISAILQFFAQSLCINCNSGRNMTGHRIMICFCGLLRRSNSRRRVQTEWTAGSGVPDTGKKRSHMWIRCFITGAVMKNRQLQTRKANVMLMKQGSGHYRTFAEVRIWIFVSNIPCILDSIS